jgi:hypothetical protein
MGKRALKKFCIWILEKTGVSRRFISSLRKEWFFALTRMYSFFSLKQRAVLKRLRKANELRINLACGQFNQSGWIGMDSSFSSRADVIWDLRKKLPLHDSSCSYLFCEHFLEHLVYPEETELFLSECRRILRKEGILRLILPDTKKFAVAYTNDDEIFLKKAAPEARSLLAALNAAAFGVPFGEHYYLYDVDFVSELLYKNGFSKVRTSKFGEGCPASILDRKDKMRILESMYIEAEK